MDELCTRLGIPVSCVFLVKNYEEKTNIRDDIDPPILCALRQIISSGDGFLDEERCKTTSSAITLIVLIGEIV